ncbi:putative CAMK/CAMKL/AMPK protein kinase [Blattamonas nauphoetae]|uniref:non-specific serine/threonine protein kinase n=1 Tax=Blattamonas nauphoetae TaxID=2049346 RepID=A0ABQ9X712_9EUKA|nr:putative CAMK/CAMKL/AMPK protein kinase [Blattamonas nauphoetae]
MIEAKIYDVHCSDIWSCGEIMFALVCGFIPFEDQNTQALFQKILHARHCHPSTLPAECRKIISKNREFDPTKHYTAAQINQHPWYIDNFVDQSIIELVVPEGGEKGEAMIDSKLLLEKKQREAHKARTVSKLTPIAENAGEPKGVVKVEHVAPIEGKAKAALSKRKTAAKIVTSNQPSGKAKGANEPAAEEKKESDEKNMETVKKKVTTSKNVHKRHATVVYVD